MDTIEFTTPSLHTPPEPAITADLAGQQLTLHRPQDWVLASFATIFDADTDHAQRAHALLRYTLGTLGEDNYQHLLHRSIDTTDPLDLDALLHFTVDTWSRWADCSPPVDLTHPTRTTSTEPIHIRNRDLQLDATACPPNDLVLTIATATITRSSPAGHRWGIDYFLENTLPTSTAHMLMTRLDTPNDPLRSAHLEPMIATLTDRWTRTLTLPCLHPPDTAPRHRAPPDRTRPLGDPEASTTRLQPDAPTTPRHRPARPPASHGLRSRPHA